ncbi:MAG: cyclic nucleotide-binding domain-containing protein [Actinobacteria bacterium]|nr:cyclic nucleotide-binding domain-containing protein [Actinomycetota bacterium]
MEQLSRVPLFSGCSKRELRAIASAAKEVNHPAGKVLAREGDKGIGFFLIMDGRASVTIEGRKRTTLRAGDFFGEISLLDQGPRTATVTAETPVRMMGITAWVFRSLIQDHPSIAVKMLEEVARRLRKADLDSGR